MPAAVAGVKTHRFYSRGRLEKLVRQPQVDVPTMMGTLLRQQESVSYSFAPNGWLEVYEGQDVIADGPMDPETLQRTEQDAVAWLSSHPLLNTRFWHEGHEPDRPLPTENDFMATLTDAAAALTPEPVRVALEQELATHKRPVLVKAAERTLETIEAMNAQMAERQSPDEVT